MVSGPTETYFVLVIPKRSIYLHADTVEEKVGAEFRPLYMFLFVTPCSIYCPSECMGGGISEELSSDEQD
jgi:hypothetical protein